MSALSDMIAAAEASPHTPESAPTMAAARAALAAINAHPDLNPRTERTDGWTAERERDFLSAIAEGHRVEAACRIVGMSHQSAYAFRRRAAGATFALGWQAASLLARNKIADVLVARALDGQVDTYTRADGETITRHRYDNRLATTILARLDRHAEALANDGTHHAARLVAQEFDAFLDLVERGEGPARAGLFLGLRAAGEASDADLAPIIALARADRWCRTGAALADDVSVADLDPATRANWTADQWQRAEAAGLVALASTPTSPSCWSTVARRRRPISSVMRGRGRRVIQRACQSARAGHDQMRDPTHSHSMASDWSTVAPIACRCPPDRGRGSAGVVRWGYVATFFPAPRHNAATSRRHFDARP